MVWCTHHCRHCSIQTESIVIPLWNVHVHICVCTMYIKSFYLLWHHGYNYSCLTVVDDACRCCYCFCICFFFLQLILFLELIFLSRIFFNFFSSNELMNVAWKTNTNRLFHDVCLWLEIKFNSIGLEGLKEHCNKNNSNSNI